MIQVKKKYIVNEQNERIAVQIDLNTFNKIEQLLEDHALGKFLEETKSDTLSLAEAQSYYKKLKKEDD